MSIGVLVGKYVSYYRHQLGLSQTDVAMRTGLSQPFLSRLEAGYVQDVLMSTALILSTAIGIPLSKMFGPWLDERDRLDFYAREQLQQQAAEAHRARKKDARIRQRARREWSPHNHEDPVATHYTRAVAVVKAVPDAQAYLQARLSKGKPPKPPKERPWG